MCELVAGNMSVVIQDITLEPEDRSCLRTPRKSSFDRSVPMSELLKTSDSPQIKVLNEWLHGLQTRDMDLIARHLHKGYRNVIHPRSLGKPERTKEEYLKDLVELFNLWTEREVNYTGCC